MKTIFRRLVKGIATLIAATAILFITLVIFFQTETGRTLALRIVDRSIPGTFSCNGWRIFWGRGEIRLWDVRLRGPAGKPLAGFDRFVLDLRLDQLLRGRIHIAEIRLSSPFADVSRDETGRFRLEKAFHAGKKGKKRTKSPDNRPKGSPPPLVVESLLVEEGSLRFISPEAGNIRLDAIQLSGAVDVPADSGRFDFRVGGGRVSAPGFESAVSRLEGRAVYGQNKISDLALHVESKPLKLSVSGRVTGLPNNPRPELSVDLSANLTPLKALFPSPLAPTGSLQVQADVGGPPENPEGTFTLRYGGGRIGPLELEEAAFTGHLREKRFVVKTFRIRHPAGRLEASGEADISAVISSPRRYEDIAGHFKLTAEADLSGLNRWVRVAGSGNAKLTAEAKGTPASPQVDITAELKNANIGGETIDQVSLEAKINNDRLSLPVMTAALPRGRFLAEGSVELKNAFPGGLLQPPKDLSALAYRFTVTQEKTPLSRYSAEFFQGGEVSSKLTIKGRGTSPQTLTADAAADIAVTGLQCGPLVKPVDLTLTAETALEKGIAEIRDFTIKANGITAGAEGRYHLAESQADIEIDLNIPKLRTALSPLGIADVSGELTIKNRVSGSLRAPEAVLTLSAAQLSKGDITIGDLDGKVVLKPGGTVQLERLAFRNQEAEITGSGSVTLFTRPFVPHPNIPLDITITAKDIPGNRFLAASPVQGKMNGKIRVSGSVKAPVLEADINAVDLAAADHPLGDGALSARFEEGRVSLTSLKLSKDSTELNLRGTADVMDPETLSLKKAPTVDLTLSGTVVPTDIRDSIPLKEPFTLTADVTGALSDPNATLTIAGKQITPPGLSPLDLTVNLAYTGGRVAIQALDIKGPETEIHLGGEVEVQKAGAFQTDPEIRLDLTTSIQPDVLMKDAPLSGRIEASASVSGRPRSPKIAMNLTGTSLAAAGISLGKFSGNLRYESGRVHIDGLSLVNKSSSLQVKGGADLLTPGTFSPVKTPSVQAKITADIDPNDFFADLFKSGRIAGAIDIDGPLESPSAALTLNAKTVSLPGVTLGDAAVNARFSEGTVKVTSFRLQNGKSILTAKGKVHLLEPDRLAPLSVPRIQLTVNGEPLFVKDFTDAFNGKLVLSAALSGPVKHPEGTVTLSGENIDFGAQTIPALDLSARLGDDRLHLQTFEIAFSKTESIRAAGWVSPFEKTLHLDVESNGINLKRFTPIQKTQAANGTLTLALSARGRFDDPAVSGDLRIQNLRVREKPFDDFHVDLQIKNRQATVKGRLNFDVSADYHLDTQAFSANVTFDDTELAPYLRLADQNDMTGTVSGTIRAEGPANDWKQITASADLTKLVVKLPDTVLLSSRRFDAKFADGAFTLNRAEFDLLSEGHLSARGTGRIGGDINGKLSGRIPLRAAGKITNALPDPIGEIHVDVDVAGSVKSPDVQGEIRLAEVGCTVPFLFQRLHDVNGTIHLTPKAVRVKTLSGGFDSGGFDISGNLQTPGFTPEKADFTIKVNAIPVHVPDQLSLLFDADLTFEGVPDKSRLLGDIVLLEGEYTKDVNLNPLTSIGKRKREVEPMAADVQTPYLKNLELEVNVRRRDPFVIDNNLAQLQISPDLTIGGSLNHPLISGRAAVDSGSLMYRKRRFDVNKGTIDFLNPYRIEPTLDIRGESEIREWTISLSVTGTPQALDFQLASDPRENHEDIISLLTLGKTSREMIQGEGGAAISPTELVTGFVADTFGEDVKEATGLDIFEVEVKSGESPGDDANRVQVTLGKELSKRMTVKYAVESRDGEMVQRAITEYQLSDNITVSGFQENKGAFGGELQYQLDFR